MVEAVLNLGKADAQIQLAGNDLIGAAAEEDLEAMRGAADGWPSSVERLMPQIDRSETTRETAPRPRGLRCAFPPMLEGAATLRARSIAGDSAGIAAAAAS